MVCYNVHIKNLIWIDAVHIILLDTRWPQSKHKSFINDWKYEPEKWHIESRLCKQLLVVQAKARAKAKAKARAKHKTFHPITSGNSRFPLSICIHSNIWDDLFICLFLFVYPVLILVIGFRVTYTQTLKRVTALKCSFYWSCLNPCDETGEKEKTN